jgi:hypothetical protein
MATEYTVPFLSLLEALSKPILRERRQWSSKPFAANSTQYSLSVCILNMEGGNDRIGIGLLIVDCV